MSPHPIHEIKFFMSHAQISEERNDIIAKSPRNCNLSTDRIMPLVSYLKVKKVMHTMSCNPCNNVDKQIIAQRIHFFGEEVIW